MVAYHMYQTMMAWVPDLGCVILSLLIAKVVAESSKMLVCLAHAANISTSRARKYLGVRYAQIAGCAQLTVRVHA